MSDTAITASELSMGIPIDELTSANPILNKNQLCVVKIDGIFKLKMGDGVTAFNDLPYLSAESDSTKADITYVDGIMSELNSTIESLIDN